MILLKPTHRPDSIILGSERRRSGECDQVRHFGALDRWWALNEVFSWRKRWGGQQKLQPVQFRVSRFCHCLRISAPVTFIKLDTFV